MIVLNNGSKTIPVSMCGANKNSRHGNVAFECVSEHEDNGNVITVEETSESKAA